MSLYEVLRITSTLYQPLVYTLYELYHDISFVSISGLPVSYFLNVPCRLFPFDFLFLFRIGFSNLRGDDVASFLPDAVSSPVLRALVGVLLAYHIVCG